jgi:hypothetical protein
MIDGAADRRTTSEELPRGHVDRIRKRKRRGLDENKKPGHNLQRARAQFALLADMERRFPEMEDIVCALSGRNKAEDPVIS